MKALKLNFEYNEETRVILKDRFGFFFSTRTLINNIFSFYTKRIRFSSINKVTHYL